MCGQKRGVHPCVSFFARSGGHCDASSLELGKHHFLECPSCAKATRKAVARPQGARVRKVNIQFHFSHSSLTCMVASQCAPTPPIMLRCLHKKMCARWHRKMLRGNPTPRLKMWHCRRQLRLDTHTNSNARVVSIRELLFGGTVDAVLAVKNCVAHSPKLHSINKDTGCRQSALPHSDSWWWWWDIS